MSTDLKHIAPKISVNGKVAVPSSKSYAQRVIALSSLSDFPITILNIGQNEDVKAAIQVIQELGAQVERGSKQLKILKGITTKTDSEILIHCLESGLSTRLFSCFSLLYDKSFKVEGEGSILKRSMAMVIEGLEEFGKNVESNAGFLPLKIEGKLSSSKIYIDGSQSSQFLTGLLLTTPFLRQNTVLNVKNLVSRPYVDITLSLLNEFGIKCTHSDYKEFIIPGNQTLKNIERYEVEGDWSSASFLLVAAAIGGRVEVGNLNSKSVQGDRKILDVLEAVGATILWNNKTLIVEKGNLKNFSFDATDTPDLFPPLVILAAYCEGISKIKGVHRLSNKESHRAQSLIGECSKAGIKVEIKEDEMWVYGSNDFQLEESIEFDSHNDHRIAMAMSLLSIRAKEIIKINRAGAVSKSYPDFFEDFFRL